MNKLILKEMSNKQIIYLYFPENKGESGVIIYNLDTGNAQVASHASEDITGSYAHKALKKVSEFVSKKNLPMDFIQAWY